jgi:hypothetical protein
MIGKRAVLAFILIVSGFVSIRLYAQDQGSVRGTLGGVVVDPAGAIIQGASVTILGPTGNAEKTSNDQGEFSFPGLIPGMYDVKVAKDGFKGTTVQKVEVGINKVSAIRVALELGAVTQTIEVVGTSVSVESQSTAVTTDIADTVYDNLPLGRSITSVFYVSPGVVSGLGTGSQNPAISGATGLENAYIADGVLLNDAAFGGLGVYQRRYGGLGVGINSSFVKEVQVSTAAFGPQYGHTTGGVVNMVTKSGSTAFHGVVGGYFQEPSMEAAYANQDDFGTVNKIGRELGIKSNEGDFELGGYIPLGYFKSHLFFFGAFNPTWDVNYVQPVPGTGLFTATNGLVDRRDTIWDYAGKLTWQINGNHQIEGSVFGDPTHSNLAPWQTLNINNTSADTAQNFGGRNLAVRYSGILGSSLTVDAAFTMNWNYFGENPLPVVNITDETQSAGLPGQAGAFRAQGYGSFETYDSNQKGIQFDVHKVVTIFGQQHTFTVGYNWVFPTYNDTNGYSGGNIPIPVTNVTGDHYLGSNEAAVAGQAAEYHLLLELASGLPGGLGATCTLCPYMSVPGYSTPQQVVLFADRGPYNAFTSVNTAKNHAAYVNDEWEMSKYATLSLGVRWEQQRMTSGGVSQVINDQWNPRIGFTVDPKGDRKSKIYANFGRYAWTMPLDAAIRELTSQDQVQKIYFAPQTANCSGGVCGPASPADLVTLNQFGTVTFDPKNVLNQATGGIAQNPTVLLVSGGGSSPFAPGTRMEYTDEFVVGAEHEFRGGVTTSVRYIDRRVKRIIEDFTGISVEQGDAGFPGAYFIGNVNSKTDVTVNPKPVTFPGINFSNQATQTAFLAALKSEQATPSAVTETALEGFGVPANCFDSNNGIAPIDPNETNTFGTSLGGVCFPSITGAPWTTGGTTASLTSGVYGGVAGSDGKPDGYPDPQRNYQAIEIEVNKAFSHNWSLIANWRISRLIGNFEGAFRNDNGQNDPGISSLYDYTPGVLNTIADMLKPGPLNSDRLHVVNIYPTYVFDKRFVRGLVITPGVRIQSGVPLTTLEGLEPYSDSGEIPLFGRGDLGRAPVTGTIDVHLDYPWRISETKSLHFSVDMLNIANTRRELLIDQNADLAFGVLNADFMKPGTSYQNAAGTNLVQGFVQPFNARFHVAFNF